jgi:hypothetical protein
MTMLAEAADAVIGIDTHRDTHEVEIADAAGKPIAARQEQRAPSKSQHGLTVMLPLVHLLKLLKDLVAQLVPLSW